MGYRISWSGGKDSTATVILAHQQGIEVDSIDYVDIRYNAHISAQLPFVADFIDTASERFRQWGYKVRFLKPDKTAVDLAYTKYSRSRYQRNGLYVGVCNFCRGHCSLSSKKLQTLKKLNTSNKPSLVGIAIDEPIRLSRLKHHNAISLLAYANITEYECFDICRKENLLSPVYDSGFQRDGCFFCPNVRLNQIRVLKEQFPMYYNLAIDLVDIGRSAIEAVPNGIEMFKSRSNWIKEYYNGKR